MGRGAREDGGNARERSSVGLVRPGRWIPGMDWGLALPRTLSKGDKPGMSIADGGGGVIGQREEVGYAERTGRRGGGVGGWCRGRTTKGVGRGRREQESSFHYLT
jgi:hypothetical protein